MNNASYQTANAHSKHVIKSNTHHFKGVHSNPSVLKNYYDPEFNNSISNNPVSNNNAKKNTTIPFPKNALYSNNSSVRPLTKTVTQPEARLSFQLMTRAEPAQMVIATIESLLAIKSDDDEIIIVDNNHNKTELYEPLAAYCAALDPSLQVKFYHIDAVAGFKSGALNLALGLMNPFATHVVVVDSDYQALPHARTAIVQAIQKHPQHALLQFPQFYRDAGLSDVHSELNHYFNHHLYRPFNQSRALSTGTYAVIRRDALLKLGGWSGASITEDAQMGVLMHRQGFQSQFIPQVIANGLLPTTVCDLMAQRQRWIYGNMQVMSSYFSIKKTKVSELKDSDVNGANFNQTKTRNYNNSNINNTELSRAEHWQYLRAHLSQLNAWVNFTGIFIILQLCVLMIIAGFWISGQAIDSTQLLLPLYAVFASYGLFLGRRLWAYAQDKMPLNKQAAALSGANQRPAARRPLRTWLLHLNFWELGALSWLPILWGRDKPFICTPKQKTNQSRRAIWLSNIAAIPKSLLLLNIATLLLVAPFSPLYSPLLFVCASGVVVLKLAAAALLLVNYDVPATVTDAPIFITKKGAAHMPKPHAPYHAATSIKNKPLINTLKSKETMNY